MWIRPDVYLPDGWNDTYGLPFVIVAPRHRWTTERVNVETLAPWFPVILLSTVNTDTLPYPANGWGFGPALCGFLITSSAAHLLGHLQTVTAARFLQARVAATFNTSPTSPRTRRPLTQIVGSLHQPSLVW